MFKICFHLLFTWRGDICISFKFPTRSLDKHGHNDPGVHLFVKRHEIQNFHFPQWSLVFRRKRLLSLINSGGTGANSTTKWNYM